MKNLNYLFIVFFLLFAACSESATDSQTDNAVSNTADNDAEGHDEDEGEHDEGDSEEHADEGDGHEEMSTDALGTWAYTIKNLPDGDATGNIVIKANGNEYLGSINSDLGSTDLYNIKVNDNKLTCNFDFDAYKIEVNAMIDGDKLTGDMSAEGSSFPMTANRTKK